MEKIVKRKREFDVDSTPAKSSKSIGVVIKKSVKKDIEKPSTSQTSSMSNKFSETSEKSKVLESSPSKPALSLISCDYGSSSSNDEEDN